MTRKFLSPLPDPRVRIEDRTRSSGLGKMEWDRKAARTIVKKPR